MIYCIDFDDCLDENTEMINKVNNLFDSGNIIIIHTARAWSQYGKTYNSLEEQGVKFNTLACGKVYGDIYVDDKNITMEEFLK